MTIDFAEIKKIAKLAHLALTECETENLSNDLNNIFKFIEKLNEINTEGVTPLLYPHDTITATLRSDVISEIDQRSQLQSCAPLVEEGLYLVPKVIEK